MRRVLYVPRSWRSNPKRTLVDRVDAACNRCTRAPRRSSSERLVATAKAAVVACECRIGALQRAAYMVPGGRPPCSDKPCECTRQPRLSHSLSALMPWALMQGQPDAAVRQQHQGRTYTCKCTTTTTTSNNSSSRTRGNSRSNRSSRSLQHRAAHGMRYQHTIKGNDKQCSPLGRGSAATPSLSTPQTRTAETVSKSVRSSQQTKLSSGGRAKEQLDRAHGQVGAATASASVGHGSISLSGAVQRSGAAVLHVHTFAGRGQRDVRLVHHAVHYLVQRQRPDIHHSA